MRGNRGSLTVGRLRSEPTPPSVGPPRMDGATELNAAQNLRLGPTPFLGDCRQRQSAARSRRSDRVANSSIPVRITGASRRKSPHRNLNTTLSLRTRRPVLSRQSASDSQAGTRKIIKRSTALSVAAIIKSRGSLGSDLSGALAGQSASATPARWCSWPILAHRGGIARGTGHGAAW